jgi:hypothetical protein
MPGFFTNVEVGDPRLVTQSIWENLPPSEKVLLTEREFSSQEWAPLDQRRFRIEPESYRTEVSIADLGALRLSRSVHSQATRYTTQLPAVAVGRSIRPCQPRTGVHALLHYKGGPSEPSSASHWCGSNGRCSGHQFRLRLMNYLSTSPVLPGQDQSNSAGGIAEMTLTFQPG